MQQRISITLEAQEIAALIADARANMRHPREQLRYILMRDLEQRGLLAPANDADGSPSTSEVDTSEVDTSEVGTNEVGHEH